MFPFFSVCFIIFWHKSKKPFSTDISSSEKPEFSFFFLITFLQPVLPSFISIIVYVDHKHKCLTQQAPTPLACFTSQLSFELKSFAYLLKPALKQIRSTRVGGSDLIKMFKFFLLVLQNIKMTNFCYKQLS